MFTCAPKWILNSAIAVGVVFLGAGVAGAGNTTSLFIETHELNAKLNNNNLAIIDTRSAEDYAQGHIPGAVNAPARGVWYEAWNTHETREFGLKGINMILSKNSFEKAMSNMGIAPEDHVVVHFGPAGRPHDATRQAWTLLTYGHENVSVLNGNFEKWVKDGYPVTTDKPEIRPTNYLLNP